MFIRDNFSEMSLLFSEPVSFTIYNDATEHILLAKFQIKLPTVRDINFNEELGFLLSFLRKTVTELKQEMKMTTEFNSHLDLISLFSHFKKTTPTLSSILYKIITGLKVLCPFFDLENDILTIQKQTVTDELLERIRSIILMAIGAQQFVMNTKYLSPEQRAMEEKIQAIKNKGNKNTGDTSFEKIYMILTYEFGYSREEILNMTMYAVKTILKYTSKSINYKLTLAAKAYGNTKKVKFITDKGD